MKRYNRLKNSLTASLTALLYNNWVIDDCTIIQRAFGVITVFVCVMVVLAEMDRVTMERRNK